MAFRIRKTTHGSFINRTFEDASDIIDYLESSPLSNDQLYYLDLMLGTDKENGPFILEDEHGDTWEISRVR